VALSNPGRPPRCRDRVSVAQATRAIGNDLDADYHIVCRAVLAPLSLFMALVVLSDPVLYSLERNRFGHASPQRRRAPGLIRKVRPRGLVRLEGAGHLHGSTTPSRDCAARNPSVECLGAWLRAVRRTCRGRSCHFDNFGLRNPQRAPVEGGRVHMGTSCDGHHVQPSSGPPTESECGSSRVCRCAPADL
jgi:hypothetical protein